MTRQKIKELIPLILVVGGLIYTAIAVLATDTVLTRGHLFAYGLTSVVILAYFLNRAISNILLGLTLILGLANILIFVPVRMTVGAGIGEAVIELQFFSLIAFVTFVYAHGKAFLAWVNKDGL